MCDAVVCVCDAGGLWRARMACTARKFGMSRPARRALDQSFDFDDVVIKVTFLFVFVVI